MALHLLKLSVGVATVEDLEAYIARRRAEAIRQGLDTAPFHTTRMIPKRAVEIAGKGSIYWVIKGTVACRQAITAIEPVTGADGIGRCRLVFEPEVTRVSPRPCRPFQGGELAEMPETLRRELATLGLI